MAAQTKTAKTAAKTAVKKTSTAGAKSASSSAKAATKAPAKPATKKTPAKTAAKSAGTKAATAGAKDAKPKATAKKAAAEVAKKSPAKQPAAKAPAAKSTPAKSTPAKSAATKAATKSSAKASAQGAAKSRLSAADVKEFTELIQAELDRVRREYDDSMAALDALKNAGQDSAGDDPADAGTNTFEREQEMSIAHNRLDLIAQMERAMARIAAGTYGACESCGELIPKARLQAFPQATLCVSCKAREERR